MKIKLEQFQANNPHPMLIIAKDNTIFYTNNAGEPLLDEWRVKVGEKLPSYLGELVRKVMSLNVPEKIEVKAGKRAYLVIFYPSPEEGCVEIYGFDISEQKELEKKLLIKEKQNDVLHKIGKMALGDESLQTFMDESVKLIARILELEYCKIMELLPDGRFLMRAGIGWKSEFVGKQIVEGGNGSQAGYTLLSGMPLIVEDFEEENRFTKPKILEIHGVASGASVVIGNKEKIFGVLVVNSTKKRNFTSDDTYFLNSVAFLIAQVIERKKAEEALKKAHDNLETKVKERTDELEEAYKSLKESEKGLAEAQRIAHIGSWDWNIVTGELHWSEELYRIFGIRSQESIPTYDVFLNFVHPDDRDYIDNAFKRALKEKPFDIEHRIILVDGTERLVHAQSEVTFDEKKSPVRIRGIVQDITERKKSEEKINNLANIVESSNDAIITESLDGTITSWNKGAEQVYGYSAKEILGKNASVVEPDNLIGEINLLVGKIKQGEKIKNYETLRLKKDSTLINVSLTVSPIFDSSGKLIAISVISRDITKRKRAEEALANIETARKKEVHHRIKNNLQVISSLLDLQTEKFRDRELVENTEILSAFRESQNRVISIALIHEELHEGGGTHELNFSPYLERLVKNLFQTYKVGNAGTSLYIELEENIFFDMDIAVPLGIIINELVSNSLKYAFSGKDKGEIKIKLCREQLTEYASNIQESIEEGFKKEEFKKKGSKDTSFVLSVSDNGVGVPEGFNLESSDTLGIQLVKILVDQLGGTLEIKCINGTEFVISFKVTEEDKQI